MTTARDLLRPCPSVRENVTVGELMERIASGYEGFFAVVNNADRLIGIVTEHDLVELVYQSGEFDSDIRVGGSPAYLGWSREQLLALVVTDIMTDDPETAAPDDELDDLVATVFKNRLKVLPVVDNGKVMGVIRRSDLLKKVLG